MSLQILVVHSGEKLYADPASFATLDAFKLWLSSESSVSPAYQILLLRTGKQAKLQALLAEVGRSRRDRYD